jgi:hypothetical protein
MVHLFTGQPPNAKNEERMTVTLIPSASTAAPEAVHGEMEAADQQAATVTDADIQILREQFPRLRELPAGLVGSLTLAELVNLEKVSIQYGDQDPVGSAG